MTKDNNNGNPGFWHFVDNLQGDKVVWMIVLLLILISIVAVFSSTPLLAIQQHTTRMAIVREQMIIAALGLGLIILCYNIKSIGFFRIISQFGFIFSLFLLAFLAGHQHWGPIKASKINEAWRIISVFGFQVHVFEIVKIAMVMYLAWAVNAYKSDSFMIANMLGKTRRFAFMNKPIWKKIIYLYLPIFLVGIGIMVGSTSSAIFIVGILFITIIIGGISVREMILPGLACIIILAGCFGINKKTGGKAFPHLASSVNRICKNTDYYMAIIKKVPRGSVEFRKAFDKIQQPASAKIAIHEGKLGKGPGKSTQRYIVPVMFEDYMFSFIIEEYGIFGGIAIIILYGSLLARGSIIVRNCENHFAKTAVAGLIILISGQAMMHMFINVDLGPLTGQTLPMISHGNSSFLAFSIAFGIILSISRMASEKIKKESETAKPLIETDDEIKAELDDLDDFEKDINRPEEGNRHMENNI
jgi:cell division protein FtsW